MSNSRQRILHLMTLTKNRMEQIRMIQVIEMLEPAIAPFSVPLLQGNEDNECTVLRRWVNSGVGFDPHGDQENRTDKGRLEWMKMCPFIHELMEAYGGELE